MGWVMLDYNKSKISLTSKGKNANFKGNLCKILIRDLPQEKSRGGNLEIYSEQSIKMVS